MCFSQKIRKIQTNGLTRGASGSAAAIHRQGAGDEGQHGVCQLQSVLKCFCQTSFDNVYVYVFRFGAENDK